MMMNVYISQKNINCSDDCKTQQITRLEQKRSTRIHSFIQIIDKHVGISRVKEEVNSPLPP